MGRRGAVAYHNPWAASASRREGDPVPAEYGPVAWRPLPTLGPEPLQKGVYGDIWLNQYPAYYDEPQLFQGVEGFNSHLQTPDAAPEAPPYDLLRTTSPNNIAGGQRFGQGYTGPIGPLNAFQLRQRVAVAQVRQSGLQAMQWAQGLSLQGQSE